MNRLEHIDRYWQTLRHLRPVQIYGRLRFRLARPIPELSPAPPIRQPTVAWRMPAQRRPSLVGPGEFLFLSEAGRLKDCGWDDPKREKLWRYNQHYFDDLNARDAADRRDWHKAILEDWLVSNAPGEGTGWEPYPTSLRIVNWIKWALAGNDLPDACRESLAVQVRWLLQRLEWHLLGNHLFANAKALVFAGLFFNGPEAQGWLEEGLRILAREVPEQILPDGGQFELSPMYHALALEDLLDLVNVARSYRDALAPVEEGQVEDWARRIPDMRRWLAALSHPDGGIAFFNDAAFGIAPDTSELDAYAARLGCPVGEALSLLTWLPISGYARLSQQNSVLIADMARVGPGYLPGHAHADTLSFEFSIFGQRLFVNSGTSVYGTGTERLRQRGTAAHNTVTVAGQNSSDVWSGFRVGRRAAPLLTSVAREGEELVAEAAHDGYRWLPGHPLHNRCWRLSSRSLRIEDALDGASLASEARFHLHPAIQVQQTTAEGGAFILQDGQSITWRADSGPLRVETSTWHPEFGLSKPSTCLVIPLRDGRAALEVSWT